MEKIRVLNRLAVMLYRHTSLRPVVVLAYDPRARDLVQQMKVGPKAPAANWRVPDARGSA